METLYETPVGTRKFKARDAAAIVVKCAGAALVLWLVFRKVDVHRFVGVLMGADRRLFLCGVSLDFLTIVIAGWRWRQLLKVVEIQVSLFSLVCIAQIGQFFLMFLPGPTGDDLTRMLYISRIAKGRVAQALTTVLVDRFIGLAAILLLAVICIPGQWQILASAKQTKLLAVFMVAGGAVVAIASILFFSGKGRRSSALVGRFGHLLGPAGEAKAREIQVHFAARKGTILGVAAAAVAVQLILCVMFYLAGCSVGVRLSLWAWLSFVPVVLAASAAPITIAGLGVREYFLVLFLGVFAGVDQDHALAASAMAFCMMFAVNLFGGIVYVAFRTRVVKDGDGKGDRVG